MSHANSTLLEALQKENTEQKEEISQLRGQVDRLEHKIQRLLQELYGKKSEKLHPDELLDVCRAFFTQEEFDLLEEMTQAPAVEPEPAAEADLPERAPRPKRSRERKLIREDFPRETIDVLLDPEDCECPSCSREMNPIGFKVVEKLGFRPALFYVQEYRLETRACDCGGGIATALLPPQPVPKGKAAPDLLAHTVVSKFGDHLPFYRQSKIYERYGVEIADTTLVEWSNQVSDLLEPIVLLMIRQVLASGYLQADETGLPVLVRGNGQCHKAYLWSYGAPGGNVIFDFRMGRHGEGPSEFLADYEGKLQSDAYAGYDETKKRVGITWFACMAHARRYFKDAQETATERSAKVLRFIQGLYRVEAEARDRDLSAEDRRELRQQKSRPLLAALHRNLKELEPEVLPKSPIGQAVRYSLKRWDDLTRYVEHGEVEIDNNLQENALRGVAVGRRNWLFAGSESGGHKAARLYTIVETCKRIGIDPLQYLTDVLARIPATPLEELEELTPLLWKAERDPPGG